MLSLTRSWKSDIRLVFACCFHKPLQPLERNRTALWRLPEQRKEGQGSEFATCLVLVGEWGCFTGHPGVFPAQMAVTLGGAVLSAALQTASPAPNLKTGGLPPSPRSSGLLHVLLISTPPASEGVILLCTFPPCARDCLLHSNANYTRRKG